MKKLLTPLLAILVAGCQQASTANPVELEVIPAPEPKWTCPTCTESEKYVLRQLQDTAEITDKNALATILGNIKQESMFHSNICEGGARVPYHNCYSGGYGLIQWTSINRYRGLGSFCNKYGCDPSSLEGQVRYMINESHFQKVLVEFKNPGRSIDQYMVPSYYWLGWGVDGSRVSYSYNYARQLVKG